MEPVAKERLDRIHRIVDELEDADERCEAARRLESPEELLELARYYNWDDGLAVPRAIIDHPECDRGLALHLFELADGIVWLTSDDDWKYQEEWADFCKDLSARLQKGHYATVKIPFETRLTKVQQFKAKRDGVPDIFLSTVAPEQTMS